MRYLVFGLGKSGTSSFAYGLAKATGIDQVYFERAVHDPVDPSVTKLLLNVMPFSAENWKQKFGNGLRWDRRLFLSRDPRDRLVSAWCYQFYENKSLWGRVRPMLERKHDGERVPLVQLMSTGPVNPGTECERIRECLRFREECGFPFADVAYEDALLGVSVDGIRVTLADVPAAYSRVKRTATYGEWKNWFTEEDVLIFRPLFEEFMYVTCYAPDWELSDEPPSRESGVDWIDKLVGAP